MSEAHSSGSIPTIQVIAHRLASGLEGADRRLLAGLYAIDALWHAHRSKPSQDGDVQFPASLAGASPIRSVIQSATAEDDSSQRTAARSQKFIDDFVSLNAEAIGFGGELRPERRDVSASRLPLSLLLELEEIARPDRMFGEDTRLPADIMGVLLNSGRDPVDEEMRRPGEEFSAFLASLCPLQEGAGVLDLSCGTGTLLDRLLEGRTGVHVFGQDQDQELAVLSWLRLRLHPSTESVHVKVGDPLRYDYEVNARRRPIDVAVLHSLEFQVAEDVSSVAARKAKEMDRAFEQASLRQAKLQEKFHLEKGKLVYFHDGLERAKRAAADKSEPHAEAEAALFESFCRDQTKLIASVEAELNDARKCAEDAALERRAALERARRPEADRTTKLVEHALKTVRTGGTVVAVVSARHLFKSPQVDQLRAQGVEGGLLDMVVEFPRGLDGSQERVAVIVFRKDRKPDPVLFVDVSDHEAVVASRRHAEPEANLKPTEKKFSFSFSEVWGRYRIGLRRTRSNLFTAEYFQSVASICLGRRPVASIAATVALADLAAKSADGRQADLRPRQFLAAVVQDGPAADLPARLAASHAAVAAAEDGLAKARQALGLPSLSTSNRNPLSPRRPGTH